jgi:hypothetical protein
VAAASHIEYLVTTRSSLPGWAQPEVSVRRRFNDFVGLAELLKVRGGSRSSRSSSTWAVHAASTCIMQLLKQVTWAG